jgi:hypothetical protein
MNAVLGTEFDKYLVEHPEVAERIPTGAIVILMPEDDPELAHWNLEVARQQRTPGQPLVCVHIRELAPERSRLVNPTLEMVE